MTCSHPQAIAPTPKNTKAIVAPGGRTRRVKKIAGIVSGTLASPGWARTLKGRDASPALVRFPPLELGADTVELLRIAALYTPRTSEVVQALLEMQRRQPRLDRRFRLSDANISCMHQIPDRSRRDHMAELEQLTRIRR